MILRRSILRVAPAAAFIFAVAPVAAHADLVPAPPASASGVAAQVGSLLDISKTGATAGSGAPSSEASVLRLAEQPVLNLGGSQTGDGETGGSLVDTGDLLPARAQVAPWHAAADGTHTPTRHARGSAAVARAELPDLLGADVLSSESEATYTDQRSTGRAVSDGAHVDLLDALRIVLLHSETTSEGQGSSYLVGLNGTEIGTDEQLGNSPLCALNLAGLADLSCLTASGGGAALSGAAQVLGVDPALDAISAIDPVAAFTASSSSGVGGGTADAVAPATAAAPATDVDTSRSAAPAAVGAQTSSTLPRTGSAVAALAGLAVTLLILGFGLRRFGALNH